MYCCKLKEKNINNNSDLRFKCMWDNPPVNTRMGLNDIHVWRISLDQKPDVVNRFEQFLDKEERSRAFSYRFKNDKRRYIVRHGALKKILNKYLCTKPGAIQFKYTRFGKPLLSSNTSFHLNMTHSKEYAILAVARNRSIGIDLEYMLPVINMDSMMKSVLTDEEYEMISVFSPLHRFQAFYDLWTLKEAYLKATGDGINKICDVAVLFSMDCSSVSVVEKGNKKRSDNFTFLQLDPAHGYTAGLAVEGNDKSIISFYDYTCE